jgi:hypothetical protein
MNPFHRKQDVECKHFFQKLSLLRCTERDEDDREIRAVISIIEPVLKANLEALKHLSFDAFDVSELAPTSHITVFERALNLYDKLFHQPQLIRIFFSQMLFAKVRSLFLPVLGS